jgi:hypothetical protein
MKNRGQMPMTQDRTILKEFWGHDDPGGMLHLALHVARLD